ncbi:MAG: chemotaxis protein CheW [Treponemataceae bacterium]|nr:chemotaxis protein CheW [Treponemataceae bacterium]
MEAVADNVMNLQSLNEEIQEEQREKIAANVDFKMVAFSLAGKDYAIDIMKVKEIAKAGRFTYVPNTAPFVLGVYNMRGDIIPILDLRLFFNIPVAERTGNEMENMIIVDVGEQNFGVVVDAIDKVVGIQKSSIQPPHPLFGDISIKYISGVVESNGHLYILLDIDRIFGARAKEEQVNNSEEQKISLVPQSQAPVAAAASTQPVAPKAAVDDQLATEYGFVKDSLKTLRKFNVSRFNDVWFRKRLSEWAEERGKDKIQLANEKDADEFLSAFYSTNTGAFWDETYANELYKMLPNNSAHQIVVWNPGCGKGYESYSLACVLRKKYPDARIRIYAQDVDLLNVSNAPLLQVPPNVAESWMKPFVSKTVSGAYTFIQTIKDMVMFEYHDCMNTSSMPAVDLIFTRDMISFLSEEQQNTLEADFVEKIKGNAVVFIGENESLEASGKWKAAKSGILTCYSKN